MNDSGLTYLLALAPMLLLSALFLSALFLSVVFWPVPSVVTGEPRSVCHALSISKTASECLRVRGSLAAPSLFGSELRPMKERMRFSHVGLRVLERSGKSRYDGGALILALIGNVGRKPLFVTRAPSRRGDAISLC